MSDPRLHHAANWEARFTVNGVAPSDFHDVLSSLTSWDDWCRAWSARAKVHESVEHPSNALENYTVTHRVLDYCRQTGTPVIFGSSREVYGEQATVPVREDAWRRVTVLEAT